MRTVVNINQGWNFIKEANALEVVNLPHTWNNIDGMDGGGDY